jgi:hypothetical protein
MGLMPRAQAPAPGHVVIARERLAPRDGPVDLAVQQLVLAVDEEAGRRGASVAALPQPLADGLAGTADEQGRLLLGPAALGCLPDSASGSDPRRF